MPPTSNSLRITVLPGDGIGPEVMQPCLALLEAVASRVGGFALSFETVAAGAGLYRDTGVAISDQALASCRKADAILLAAMGLPAVRYPDGTEVAPQLTLRFELDLYAGVRPVISVPGLPPVLRDPRAALLDFVIIRESTEGLFASRGKGVVENDSVARDTQVITRATSERLFDFAFKLARSRAARRATQGKPSLVTCVDKANIFASFAFFRKIFDERAARHPDIRAERAYVDAMALNMVRNPWALDVVVTENMFGDILSDLGAGLIGGMGMAPSADIGDAHAVFQPCHGTAPDIVGQGRANPAAMFLSAALMLEWLGERHAIEACARGAAMIRQAVDRAFADGRLLPGEMGGSAGTRAIVQAVMANLPAAV